MAKKKSSSQAERAVSASKQKKGAAEAKGKTPSKGTEPKKGAESAIPIRFFSASTFIILFIVFLVILFNPEGAIINLLSGLVKGLIGTVGFVVSIPILLYLFFIHAFSGKRPVIMRSICLGIFVLLCGGLGHLIMDPQGLSSGIGLIADLYTTGSVNSGGVLCGGFAMLVRMLLGTIITYIVLIVGAALTLLGGMQITIPSIVRAVKNRPRPDWEEEEQEVKQEPAVVVVNHIATKRIAAEEKRRQRAREEEEQRKLTPRHVSDEEREAEIMRVLTEEEAGAAGPMPKRTKSKTEAVDPVPVEFTEIPEESGPGPVIEAVEEESGFEKFPPETDVPIVVQPPKPKKVTAEETEIIAAEVAEEIEAGQSIPKPEYCYPPIDLLKLPEGVASDGTNEMRLNSDRLSAALASFKIDAKIINVTRGPSVTRYEVELAKGVRLSKLTSSAEDLALSLGASGVRIAAIPGKISVVGIEVPNIAVNTVSLREVIDSGEFAKAKSKASFAVGKDIGGSCIVGNISKLPHMLIAGTTGSGKSVCMNSIIISLLYKASPDDVKLIMVDPKMVELGIYNGIPHLLIPVVTDPKKAAGSLQWAVTEMLRRYKAMSDAGVRDLESYNAVMEMEEGNKLPQIVVIIDELADLMLVAAKEVEESICRIAQMGRASGIHLIIATQRPSSDVITGLMKANIPSRIAFSVASALESRIILDTPGAEKLVGKGDMLFAPIGSGKPKRVQGCFVSDPEVEAVATYVKEHFSSTYDQEVMEEIEKVSKKESAKGNGTEEYAASEEELEGDELLPDAVDVFLETGQASVSMLQRRLKLGYSRAARIVDEMEEKGIVGPHQGSKPRQILITKEQWALMRNGGGNATQMKFDDLSEGDTPFEDDEEES